MNFAGALPLLAALLVLLEAIAVLALPRSWPHAVRIPAESERSATTSGLLELRV